MRGRNLYEQDQPHRHQGALRKPHQGVDRVPAQVLLSGADRGTPGEGIRTDIHADHHRGEQGSYPQRDDHVQRSHTGAEAGDLEYGGAIDTHRVTECCCHHRRV